MTKWEVHRLRLVRGIWFWLFLAGSSVLFSKVQSIIKLHLGATLNPMLIEAVLSFYLLRVFLAIVGFLVVLPVSVLSRPGGPLAFDWIAFVVYGLPFLLPAMSYPFFTSLVISDPTVRNILSLFGTPAAALLGASVAASFRRSAVPDNRKRGDNEKNDKQ